MTKYKGYAIQAAPTEQDRGWTLGVLISTEEDDRWRPFSVDAPVFFSEAEARKQSMQLGRDIVDGKARGYSISAVDM